MTLSAGTQKILDLYERGRFPMATSRKGSWRSYCYDPRGVLPVSEFHIPRRLKRTPLPYQLTMNSAFAEVIAACVRPGNTWISERMESAYIELHQAGIAHSVEAWHEGELVGGLYGLALGATFCGESMFSRRDHASKACLMELHRRLSAGGFDLIDCQEVTLTLGQFGARWVSFEEYFPRFLSNRQRLCPLG